jgi:hypothetical protein
MQWFLKSSHETANIIGEKSVPRIHHPRQSILLNSKRSEFIWFPSEIITLKKPKLLMLRLSFEVWTSSLVIPVPATDSASGGWSAAAQRRQRRWFRSQHLSAKKAYHSPGYSV